MKLFNFSGEAGVVCGRENNQDLFIRKTTFSKGYYETSFHVHPNSFEFYIVIAGKITFKNQKQKLKATSGHVVYFEQNEPHLISQVEENVEMLLIKKPETEKIQL